ncbi:MAG: HAD family phosphatase [Ignavibacteriaceae bacterium]|nr:HAD family phosphatase [Ignavibacteriaceae bacterium]
MIKAIFWDNDGVLVDTEKLYYRANKETFAKMDIDLSEDLYIEYFLKRSLGTWHLAEAKGFTKEQIAAYHAERDALYSHLLSTEMKVIDGVEAALQKLYGKFKMGIVTSSKRNHFDIIHNKSHLLKYIDFVLASEDYERSKPAPDPYLKAVQLSGFNRKECIAVEDSERGLKAALSAGIGCYVIPTQLTCDSDFTGAEKILNNVSELTGILL